jgi:hypothetical protein
MGINRVSKPYVGWMAFIECPSSVIGRTVDHSQPVSVKAATYTTA